MAEIEIVRLENPGQRDGYISQILWAAESSNVRTHFGKSLPQTPIMKLPDGKEVDSLTQNEKLSR